MTKKSIDSQENSARLVAKVVPLLLQTKGRHGVN